MPLPFVFPYAVVFWGVYLWAFMPEFKILQTAKKRVREPGSRDGKSMNVIMFGLSIAGFLAFPLAWVSALQVPRQLAVPAFVVGTLLLVCGALLRRHCFRVLGTYFTGDVAAQADQPVIDRGAYAWVRHPSYSAATMMYLGIGLALGSWGSALLLTVACFAVYSYRIGVEERVLLETLGEPYRRYIAGHKRLIPFVY